MVKKSDPYLKKIDKYWNEIISMYLAFKKMKPIIEFDPNRIRIIAYPAKEYLEGLSDRTREDAKKVYREASAADSIKNWFLDRLYFGSIRLKGESVPYVQVMLLKRPEYVLQAI